MENKGQNLKDEAIEIAKDFIKISFPQIIYECCNYLQIDVNLFFISHKYKDQEKLNSIGIANIYLNLTTNIILFGITGALETLASTAYGAKKLKLLGIYLDRCRYIGLSYIILITILNFFFSRTILQLLKVDENVISLVLENIQINVFAFFFQIYYDINMRYFILIEKSYYNSIISISSLILHSIVCGVLVWDFDFGVRGVAIASTLSTMFSMIFSMVLIHSQGLPKETLVYFTKDGLREWRAYLKFAIPETLILGGEWLGYEIQGMTALFLSPLSYSTVLLTMNLEMLIFPVTAGITTTVTIKTGKKLTSEEPSKLKRFILICYGLSSIMAICGVCVVDFLGNYFFAIMSPNEEIYNSCSKIRWFTSAYVFAVNLYYFFSGVLKGLGYLRNTTIVSFIIFYLVELPLTFLFAFKFKMDVAGIWVSMVTGCTIGALIFAYWTYSFDMEVMKKKTLERIKRDNKKLTSDNKDVMLELKEDN